MSYFMQNGDVFSPTPGKEAVLETLPVGNYIVIETMMGLMFQRVDRFEAPGRMYGDINQRAERILTTFEDRPRTTGVLLSGEKGSGKSQLARNIAYAGYERGYPTILVNAPFHGDAFNALLATIEQPAIVLFDEFEKVYNQDEQQEQILTLLDGVMTSQKLFIFTVNNKYRVNDHMKNRPGRIFYAIEFNGLEAGFVREYCEENLNDTSETENVMRIAAMFKAFNFDMLKAIVEEMNRYDENAFKAIEFLNAKPISSSDSTTYEVVLQTPAGLVSNAGETSDLPMAQMHGRIGVHVEFEVKVDGLDKTGTDQLFRELGIDLDDEDEDQGPYGYHHIIESKDLKKVDVDAGRYEFVDARGFRTIFVKKHTPAYSLYDLASY